MAAKRRPSSTPPGLPSLTPAKALLVLAQQLGDAEKLLASGLFSQDTFSTWRTASEHLVEATFGANSSQVREFAMARVGPAFMTSGTRIDVNQELRRMLEAKAARLGAWVQVLSMTSEPSAAAPEQRNEVSGDYGPGQGPINGQHTGIRIFISHASQDAKLAKRLINFIEASLDAPRGTIRCTSVAGYRLDGGDDASEVLRVNLQECDVVLGMLTSASVASSYVLMELGAAWAFAKRAIPLIGPGATFGDLPGPFKDIHALRMDLDTDMMSMHETVQKCTGLQPINNLPKMMEALKEFVTAAVATQEAAEVASPLPFRT
jgi:hypothetical protein